MIDKALDWCEVALLLSAAIFCFLVGMKVVQYSWIAGEKSILKTLEGLALIYLPVLCPIFFGMFFVALFKVLEK